jgi:hypothetical protein
MITCHCPYCGTYHNYDDKFANHLAWCISCKKQFTTPSIVPPKSNVARNILIGIAAIILVIFNWEILMGDPTQTTTTTSDQIPTSENSKPFRSPFLGTKEKVHADIYRAYAEGFGIRSSDRETAVATMLLVIDDPNVTLDARLLATAVIEGIHDSSEGIPMRYEISY